jgi:cob(I)alamin adenosyltransferase
MSVTTKTGDDGYTSLISGKRVQKDDIRIKLMGNLDYLQSYLGLAKSETKDIEIKNEIHLIQQNISSIMAYIASGNRDEFTLSIDELNSIENNIKNHEILSVIESGFIIPGENKNSSLFDICRTITRSVERVLIYVDKSYPVRNEIKKYINRLSDYLYVIARYIDFREKVVNKVKDMLKQDLVKQSCKKLNLNLAKKLIELVENKAEVISLPVVIAVANEWGSIIAVHFMDGALPASYDIAVNKAYTSSAIRVSTEELGKLAKSGKELQGINNTNQNRIVIFGGGQPLEIDGIVIGAIGVSGGTAAQDTELALYGVNAFKEGL